MKALLKDFLKGLGLTALMLLFIALLFGGFILTTKGYHAIGIGMMLSWVLLAGGGSFILLVPPDER